MTFRNLSLVIRSMFPVPAPTVNLISPRVTSQTANAIINPISLSYNKINKELPWRDTNIVASRPFG